eukprot:m51a1_g10890 hypothetical protein (568) ;mRNA; f:9997-12107
MDTQYLALVQYAVSRYAFSKGSGKWAAAADWLGRCAMREAFRPRDADAVVELARRASRRVTPADAIDDDVAASVTVAELGGTYAPIEAATDKFESPVKQKQQRSRVGRASQSQSQLSTQPATCPAASDRCTAAPEGSHGASETQPLAAEAPAPLRDAVAHYDADTRLGPAAAAEGQACVAGQADAFQCDWALVAQRQGHPLSRRRRAVRSYEELEEKSQSDTETEPSPKKAKACAPQEHAGIASGSSPRRSVSRQQTVEEPEPQDTQPTAEEWGDEGLRVPETAPQRKEHATAEPEAQDNGAAEVHGEQVEVYDIRKGRTQYMWSRATLHGSDQIDKADSRFLDSAPVIFDRGAFCFVSYRDRPRTSSEWVHRSLVRPQRRQPLSSGTTDAARLLVSTWVDVEVDAGGEPCLAAGLLTSVTADGCSASVLLVNNAHMEVPWHGTLDRVLLSYDRSEPPVIPAGTKSSNFYLSRRAKDSCRTSKALFQEVSSEAVELQLLRTERWHRESVLKATKAAREEEERLRERVTQLEQELRDERARRENIERSQGALVNSILEAVRVSLPQSS